jgi:hypothetical protein
MTTATDQTSFGEQRSLPYRAARFVWKRTVVRAVGGLRATARIVRNLLMGRAGKADYKRWGSEQGLEQWWDERTKQIARLIPENTRLIEFGAGRRTMEKLIPLSSSYVPSDLVDRGPGTLVCDLNVRPLPDLKTIAPQLAVFGGVLEYIHDVDAIIRWLDESGIKTIVMSFDPVPEKCRLMARRRESLRRSYFGYMNMLTEHDLVAAFERAGYRCEFREPWTTQIIFRFVK